MIDYSELKRLAEAQPAKEWTHGEGDPSLMTGARMYFVDGPECVSDFEHWGFTRAAASFMAAASPTAVLALIAENEDYKSGQDRYEDLCEIQRKEIRQLKADLADYQQGAKAEADAGDEARAEVLRLKTEVAALRECVEDLALSLECEVKARYAGTQDHPAIRRKYDGDMQEVLDALKLIGKEKGK